MSEEPATKQSDIELLIKELREAKEEKKRKPWILTPGRAANFEKAAAKRRENVEKRKREKLEKEAFEAERQAFYEMAAKNPTGHVVSKPPELGINSMAPNKAPDPPAPSAPVEPAAPVAVQETPVVEKRVQFIEKPIMQDEVEPVNDEHDHDDGWMTKASTATRASSKMEEDIPGPPPLQRQTNAAAVAADWADYEMEKLASRKRSMEVMQQEEPRHQFRPGTGAGNHAPFEGDAGYVDSSRAMVSAEEAMYLLQLPKDMAMQYIASKVNARPTMRRQPEYFEQEDVSPVQGFLSHTRHYSQRHPSQLHNSTSSVRYSTPAGDDFLWL